MNVGTHLLKTHMLLIINFLNSIRKHKVQCASYFKKQMFVITIMPLLSRYKFEFLANRLIVFGLYNGSLLILSKQIKRVPTTF